MGLTNDYPANTAEAMERAVKMFDAGQDTKAIALAFGMHEYQVERLLNAALNRRRQEASGG